MAKKIKISSLIFLGLFIGQLLIFLIFFRVKDYVVFPSKDVKINFYTDSLDNGNSLITNKSINDSSAIVEFILRKGFVRPYTGITMSFADNKYVDISNFNELRFIANGFHLENIEVYLITTYNLKNTNDVRGDLYFTQNVNISNRRQLYVQELKYLKLPDWWFDINNEPRNTIIKPDLKHLKRISFASGLAPEMDMKRSLEIQSVKFARNNSKTLAIMLILQLGAGILLILINAYLIFKRKKNKAVIINYVPVEVEEKGMYDFMSFINSNFSNSSLSLDIVAKNTAVSQRTITEYISANYKCNFKTYINQIRINEAKRLLKETNLNISEIAFKVGFSSPNHFNRVFKNLTGDSPSGFLQKEKR